MEVSSKPGGHVSSSWKVSGAECPLLAESCHRWCEIPQSQFSVNLLYKIVVWMEFTGVKPTGLKEECQKILNEIIKGSEDGPGFSTRRFTLMEKICVR
jgi:hypothetical protein